MSWDQILLTFDVERQKDGSAKIIPPQPGKRLSQEQLFRRRYFLLGITDQNTVDVAWRKYKAEREAEIEADPKLKKAKERRERQLKKIRERQLQRAMKRAINNG